MSWGEDELYMGFSDEEWRARNCYNKAHTKEDKAKEGEIPPDERRPMTEQPRWRVTNHIHPYGIQTKDCATIEDAFQFIAENEGIISDAVIEKKTPRKCAP